VKRLLRLGAFSLMITLVFAFSWSWPAAASNLSKEERTSVHRDMAYLSLLLLQGAKDEEKNGEQEKEAKNPNKENKEQQFAENPNKKDGGNQRSVAGDSSQVGNGLVSTALVIALIAVVGAAGLWFVLRRRSS
jgi:hypothetical protein